jgi:hypothetical protein
MASPRPDISLPRVRGHDPAQTPPRRPRSFTPRELGFEPQPATRWFSPGVLTASGTQVALTSVFGSFLDKRELQQSRSCDPDLRYAGLDEVWIDYVADTGDGFDATATVAYEVARPTLQPDGVEAPLPRGDILVLGGDEVYPAASTEGYQQRLEGPWRAVLPWTEPNTHGPEHPTVYAVPGNHDWYDGLTGFLRMFGQGRWIGGWQTQQTRSYFAVKLPHGWWLWGVDIQADTLIDEPQLEFFRSIADRASPGDRLVLATAVPTWTRLEHDPHAYRNLAYLERTLLAPRGIDLKLTVAGDLHHYARYSRTYRPGDEDAATGPTHKITCGGGGAFLHPTHGLPETVVLALRPDDPGAPREPGDAVDAGAPGEPDASGEVSGYRLTTRYPTPGRSRLLSLHALLLPLRNPSFMWVPAILNVVLLWTIQFGIRSLAPTSANFAEAADGWVWTDIAGGVFRNSLSALMVVVMLFGLIAFARTPPWAPRGVPRYVAKVVLAGILAAAQVLAIATVSWISLQLASGLEGWAFATLASVLAFVIGGVACSLVLGAYLAAAIGIPGLRTHANEAFAAARLTSYKSFLRMHIDRTGALTVHAIGIDRTVKRRHWRVVPEADDVSASWIAPAGGAPRPRLIDRVTIR